jgi:hypothetical protein
MGEKARRFKKMIAMPNTKAGVQMDRPFPVGFPVDLSGARTAFTRADGRIGRRKDGGRHRITARSAAAEIRFQNTILRAFTGR